MRQNALILSLITMICLNVGCSLDDPQKLGQSCGQSPYNNSDFLDDIYEQNHHINYSILYL